MTELSLREARLRDRLRGFDRVAVAFSGGVDSTLLLRLALDTLGRERVLAVLADTPSLPRGERDEALRLASRLGTECLTVNPNELDDPDYAANPPDRCYTCKRLLFTSIIGAAASRGFAQVLDGNNADDAADFRPGRRALQELGISSPLLEAGLTKDDVRQLSRQLSLPTADKPAMACLASRLPYGTPVTRELLAQVERAEAALHAAGFDVCRVRHHGDVARIEVAPEALPRLLVAALRERVVREIRAAGYRYVALDLQGYRMGSLNETRP
jgi:pyridinium-3,5-biscarboxylic acid mononucleotide sulfurtransferase